MRFICPRDRVVVSTLGHAIEFKKGVPTEVPPLLWDLVQQHGALPESELPEPEKPKTIVPTDPAERSGLIQLALETIVTRNRREDFTAGSAPHAKVISDELGWPITPKERDAEWMKFQRKS